MIFDYKLWEEEAVAILASTVASIYATILVCVYIAFAFTDLVTYPNFKVPTSLRPRSRLHPSKKWTDFCCQCERLFADEILRPHYP
jgi:hypothetical protein